VSVSNDSAGHDGGGHDSTGHDSTGHNLTGHDSAAAIAARFSSAEWHDVLPRRVALPALDERVLLHAGPPFTGELPAPVRNAAVQAILYERMVGSDAEARALLASGAVRLAPAQDHRLVTPLAQVVSASMPVAVVGPARSPMFAPLVEGPAPGLRFGAADPLCRQRLARISALALDQLAPLLRVQPVALAGVIAHALAHGDECHARTGAANAALLLSLERAAAAAGITLDPVTRAAIESNPAFVLPLMMAAAGGLLADASHGIAAAAGNGVTFGIRLHGDSRWRTVASSVPVGTVLPGKEALDPLPAIGDSAVLDFCGLGGQALGFAPALADEWRHVLPADLAAARAAVLDPARGVVDPARVRASGVAPRVNLAILDAAGGGGLVGRGVYCADPELFAAAH
jgi:hypothetical protein